MMSHQPLFDRRDLVRSSIGLAGIAIWQLLQRQCRQLSADEPMIAANGDTHRRPKAKSVIYLHMIGAPSQLDMFDEKPELVKRDGESCPAEITKNRDFAFIGKTSRLAGSPWRFSRQGDSGQVMSELLPHLAGVADQLAIIRSMHTDEINHAPAQMFLHSGFGRGGRPSLGSWVSYGLGTENEDLPAYVALLSGPAGGAGTSLWGNGFLPSLHQGVRFRSDGDPVLFLKNPAGHDEADRRRVLDTLGSLNRLHQAMTGDPDVESRIRQYEMAFRMQVSVPKLMSIDSESRETLECYGVTPGKVSFANNCLLARNLIRSGVRFVELYDSDWDHHGSIRKRLPEKCKDIDRPIAALIKDLDRLGLLQDTLIVWASEFGRTPLGQGDRAEPGRDHHKDAFTSWLAGAGIKGGTAYGQTDDFGMDVVENPVHIHDLNATILHLLGIDHERLTYRHQGRDYRLTDVEGRVVNDLLS